MTPFIVLAAVFNPLVWFIGVGIGLVNLGYILRAAVCVLAAAVVTYVVLDLSSAKTAVFLSVAVSLIVVSSLVKFIRLSFDRR